MKSVCSMVLVSAALCGSGTAQSANTNLVINADFEAGNVGFMSQYTYTPGRNSGGGQYDVLASARTWNSWFRCFDHTTGSGLFMAINGDPSAVSVAWAQIVPVVPNSTYTAEFWLAAIDTPLNNRAKIQLRINGASVGPLMTAPGPAGNWGLYSTTWNSGAATTATLEIVDTTLASSGDDFGLDDISFVGPCPGSFRSYGTGLAGTGTVEPLLGGLACPTVGRGFDIEITSALPGAPGLFAVGLAPASDPFLGGTLLVDRTGMVTLFVTISSSGSASMSFRVPPETTYRGFVLRAQGFVLDPGAVRGVAMTSGLTITIG